jgi:hypothetical protein
VTILASIKLEVVSSKEEINLAIKNLEALVNPKVLQISNKI